MQKLGLDGHIHAYVEYRKIAFNEDGLALWTPNAGAKPSLDLPGVNWVQVEGFERNIRYAYVTTLRSTTSGRAMHKTSCCSLACVIC